MALRAHQVSRRHQPLDVLDRLMRRFQVISNFARIAPVRVDRKARVCVRQSFYSVPARFAGRQLSARIGGSRIEVTDGRTA